MTRSARRRAALGGLTPCTLSADRQEAVKAYKRTRKKARPGSYFFRQASWNAIIALTNEQHRYMKRAKQERLLAMEAAAASEDY